MNKDVVRNYHISDSVFMKYSKSVCGYLGKELAVFTAFDSTIDENFMADTIKLLFAAEEGVSDNVIVDRQVQLSDYADKKLENCNQLIRSVFYFVKKAFTSKAIHNEFGLNDYTSARKSKSKMILFMRDLDKVATKYRGKLIKAGCHPEFIKQIPVLYNELNDATQERELFMGNRPVVTQERIIKYNALWENVQIVVEAAKIVYYDNVTKLKRYLAPSYNSRTKDTEIIAESKLVALNSGIEENTVLEIKNTGKSDILFYVAENLSSPQPDNAILVAAGEQTTIKASAISNGTYGLLVAHNTGSSEANFVAVILE